MTVVMYSETLKKIGGSIKKEISKVRINVTYISMMEMKKSQTLQQLSDGKKSVLFCFLRMCSLGSGMSPNNLAFSYLLPEDRNTF